MKKVTPEQIDRLYEFTRQHYVEYYDVQTELVDHLANAIETHWQEFPNEAFEIVLQKEFRKFGVFGFMDVLEEKMKQMGRRYNRILWQKVKDFFTIPKILLTLCIGMVIFSLLVLLGNVTIVVPTIAFIILVTAISFFIKNIRIFKQNRGKKWLFEHIILHLNGYVFCFYFPFQMAFQFWKDLPNSTLACAVYSAIFTFCIILVYLVMDYLPKNRDKYLMELYPEYKNNLQMI